MFEGIDGAGKSTQARMLVDHLNRAGIKTLLTAEPSDGPIGSAIRALRSRPDPDEEERLFFEDRVRHVQEVIVPSLEKGITIVCDRYIYSSMAYQGARNISVLGIIEKNSSMPSPDITFLLEIPVDAAIDRIKRGRTNKLTVFEERTQLERVAAVYRQIEDPKLRVIDGLRSESEIHLEIMHILEQEFS